MSIPAPAHPLVLVHGTSQHAGQWAEYHALLPGVPIITLDLPGHGSRATEPFTGERAMAAIDDAVDQARELAAGLAPVLVGHSLGGYLSMIWAERHPGDLAQLVLIGATGDPAGALAWVYRMVGGWVALTDRRRTSALPAAWRFVFDNASPDLLRRLEHPVVLVNGQFDQMRVHAARFAAAAATVDVITVPRATHLLPITHPVVVAEILRRGPVR